MQYINLYTFQVSHPFFMWVRMLSKILFTLITYIILILLGLLVVAVALPFAKVYPHKETSDVWKYKLLPEWAKLWDNSYDGVWGNQKNGRNGTGVGGTWWSGYHWAAIRNPVNEWSRYMIGCNYEEALNFYWQGTSDNVDWKKDRGYGFYVVHTKNGKLFPMFVWNTAKFCIRLGWKLGKQRAADRPWAGFTLQLIRY